MPGKCFVLVNVSAFRSIVIVRVTVSEILLLPVVLTAYVFYLGFMTHLMLI